MATFAKIVHFKSNERIYQTNGLKTNIVNIIVHMMPYRRLHLPFQGDVTKLLDKKKSMQDLAELPLIYPLTVMLVLMPI